jgi:hypothetical protein
MRLRFAFIMLLLLAGIVTAQETSDFYTYEDVVRRIETARASGQTGVNLSNMGLMIFPPELLTFYDLTSLNLSNNQLSSLPAEISNLGNLSNLNLENNKLTELPAGIGGLEQLTVLELAHNQLSSLPAEIGNLGHLVRLDLSHNHLTVLPAEFANLISLCYLNLTANQFTTIPAELQSLPILTDPYCYEQPSPFSSHVPNGLYIEGYIKPSLFYSVILVVAILISFWIAWSWLKFWRRQKAK